MNITRKKQTHRYREQTSGYQWGGGNIGCGGVGGTNYSVYDRLKDISYNKGNIANIS